MSEFTFLRKKCLNEFTVLLAFLFLAFLFTYPLIFNLNSRIYMDGLHNPSDLIGGLHGLWRIKYENFRPTPISQDSLISYPFGINIKNGIFMPLFEYPLRIFAYFGNEVVAFNIFLISGVFLTAYFTYILVYSLTKSKMIGFLGGFILAFSPDQWTMSMAYLGYNHLEWMALFILFILKVAFELRYKYTILAGIFLSFITLQNYYHGYFFVLFLVSFIILKIIFDKIKIKNQAIDKTFIKNSVLLIIIFLVVISPFVYPIVINIIFKPLDIPEATLGYVRPYEHFFKYAARIWDYVVPSEFHPIWGRYVPGILEFLTGASGRHYYDATLYLGFTPIALAIYGVRRWRRDVREGRSNEQRDFIYFVFVISALVFIVFSFAPLIDMGFFKLPTPQYFLYHIAPMFRVSARFGVIVILCIAILAALGLDYLLKSIKSERKRYGVFVLIFGLVFLEYINFPPFHTKDVSYVPPVYKCIADKPGNIVIAEYPMERADSTEHYYYVFYQRIHEKPLINGALVSSPPDWIRKKLSDIEDDSIAGNISSLGGNYVIFHKKRLSDGRLNYNDAQLERIKSLAGFILEKEFDDCILFRVETKPADIFHAWSFEFYNKEKWEDGKIWRWMSENGKIVLYVHSEKSIKKDLELTVLSFARERNLKIKQGKNILKEVKVPPGGKLRVEINDIVLVQGLNILSLEALPGPEVIDDVLKNQDKRKVSIAFQEIILK